MGIPVGEIDRGPVVRNRDSVSMRIATITHGAATITPPRAESAILIPGVARAITPTLLMAELQITTIMLGVILTTARLIVTLMGMPARKIPGVVSNNSPTVGPNRPISQVMREIIQARTLRIHHSKPHKLNSTVKTEISTAARMAQCQLRVTEP
jgi:hypothetical protein